VKMHKCIWPSWTVFQCFRRKS